MRSSSSERKTLRKMIVTAAFAAVCVNALTLTGCGLFTKPVKPVKPVGNYLKDIYSDYFSFGTAVQLSHLEKYSALMPHFNSLTAEYQMKWGQLEREQGVYDYEKADSLISWAADNDTSVRGHCLVWYKSLPEWVYKNGDTGQTVLNRMNKHISETVAHFGDSVYCWDVVNEALRDGITQNDLSNGKIYRTGWKDIAPNECDWYALTGKEYIAQAFSTADAARKKNGLENVGLFYNDYSLNEPNKREACVSLVKWLQGRGIAIDGVGMQAHYRLPDYLNNPDKFISEFEESVKAFTGLGIDVHITELDIRIYANNQEPEVFDSLPYEIEVQQAQMYGDILEICRKYSVPWKNGAGRVSNVTVWGISDANNSWATEAHSEFPLLFGKDGQPKKAFYEITSF